MKISDIISIIALLISISTFIWNYCSNKKNITADSFLDLRLNVLDRFNQITLKDIEEAYRTTGNNAQKAELNDLMRKFDAYCQLIDGNVYDFKLFVKLNRGLINSEK